MHATAFRNALLVGWAYSIVRHAAVEITDQHYIDRTLIDLRGALDRLPRLPLDGDSSKGESWAATGTDDHKCLEVIGNSVHCAVYSRGDKSGVSRTNAVISGEANEEGLPHANDVDDKPGESQTTPARLHRRGFKPLTFGSVDRSDPLSTHSKPRVSRRQGRLYVARG